jgi:glycosyltransferase involved in cell wall biosynthesis
MKDSNPLVSIGMPIYNEGHFLIETLESLLSQDYQCFEIIISDNASQDETERICREYAEREPRIRYHRNEINIGAIGNFNQAFALSCGTYFTWASGHDLRSPESISRCLEVLDKDDNVVLCSPIVAHINEDGDLLDIRPEFDSRHHYNDTVGRMMHFFWSACPPDIIYGVIRSESLRAIGPAKPVAGSDYILLFKLCLRGHFAQVRDQYLYTRVIREKEKPDAIMARYGEQFFAKKERRQRWFPYWGGVRECLGIFMQAKLPLKQKVALMLGWLLLLSRAWKPLLRELYHPVYR